MVIVDRDDLDVALFDELLGKRRERRDAVVLLAESRVQLEHGALEQSQLRLGASNIQRVERPVDQRHQLGDWLYFRARRTLRATAAASAPPRAARQDVEQRLVADELVAVAL